MQHHGFVNIGSGNVPSRRTSVVAPLDTMQLMTLLIRDGILALQSRAGSSGSGRTASRMVCRLLPRLDQLHHAGVGLVGHVAAQEVRNLRLAWC